ncbi:MAG: FAD-dependent oxidoreductase [Candidatus Thiodiazotropha sp.]
MSTYSPLQSKSLCDVLREELGGWCHDPLFTPTDGMDALPEAFMKPNNNGWNTDVDLSKNIIYGIVVDTVKDNNNSVTVIGRDRATSNRIKITGDAVILTVPLQIIRQMNINLPIEMQKALANITYEAAAKMILQCKTRFWQKDVGQGGFTRTSLPIGQIHYPDWPGSGFTEKDRGLLVVYSWAHDAIIFGSQPKRHALANVVEQIKHIHPEIEEQFEVGTVQTWCSDQFAQGAFAALERSSYLTAMKALVTPTPRLYLAGEALSWSNGWIQGALFSGLMQAFNFTYYNESKIVFNPCDFMCSPI